MKKIEGNKIIAEFDNKLIDIQSGRLVVSSDNGDSWYGRLYDKDWNTLMPVVEKISRIEYDRWEEELPFGDTQTAIDTAYPRTFGMLSQEGKPMFRFNRYSLHIADTLIEAAWLAVVEFITHQNETNV